MTGNLVLIDGDILVYRVAFSCQSKIEGEVVIQPEGIARARCDQMIEDLLQNCEATECMGFLTDGAKNFRKEVAKTAPYKGQRQLEKPIHYDFVRHHLEHVHKYEMCYTQEADDMIGITHMDITGGDLSKPVIIASIDKDLLMIPGQHYHIATRERASYDIYTSMKKFFLQVLTGDRTDNIIGLQGIGPVKADKILSSARDFGSMLGNVKAAYNDKASHNRLDETAELCWIRRVAGVEWSWSHVKEVYGTYQHRSH